MDDWVPDLSRGDTGRPWLIRDNVLHVGEPDTHHDQWAVEPGYSRADYHEPLGKIWNEEKVNSPWRPKAIQAYSPGYAHLEPLVEQHWQTAAKNGGQLPLEGLPGATGAALAPRSANQALPVVCAWCNRVQQPDGSYELSTQPSGQVSHGICPDCRAQVKTSDHQGMSNWETWNTKLMIDNERETHDASRQLVQRGGTLQELQDWAIHTIIGPHNQREIADAQEWNEIPKHDRLDHDYESYKDQHGDNESAMDLLHGLVGGPNVEDSEPTIIDPQLVNWQEIYQTIEAENEENRRYEAGEPATWEEPKPQVNMDAPGDLTIPNEWISKTAAGEWEPDWSAMSPLTRFDNRRPWMFDGSDHSNPNPAMWIGEPGEFHPSIRDFVQQHGLAPETDYARILKGEIDESTTPAVVRNYDYSQYTDPETGAMVWGPKAQHAIKHIERAYHQHQDKPEQRMGASREITPNVTYHSGGDNYGKKNVAMQGRVPYLYDYEGDMLHWGDEQQWHSNLRPNVEQWLSDHRPDAFPSTGHMIPGAIRILPNGKFLNAVYNGQLSRLPEHGREPTLQRIEQLVGHPLLRDEHPDSLMSYNEAPNVEGDWLPKLGAPYFKRVRPGNYGDYLDRFRTWELGDLLAEFERLRIPSGQSGAAWPQANYYLALKRALYEKQPGRRMASEDWVADSADGWTGPQSVNKFEVDVPGESPGMPRPNEQGHPQVLRSPCYCDCGPTDPHEWSPTCESGLHPTMQRAAADDWAPQLVPPDYADIAPGDPNQVSYYKFLYHPAKGVHHWSPPKLDVGNPDFLPSHSMEAESHNYPSDDVWCGGRERGYAPGVATVRPGHVAVAVHRDPGYGSEMRNEVGRHFKTLFPDREVHWFNGGYSPYENQGYSQGSERVGATGAQWVWLDGKVAFGQEHHDIALKLAREFGWDSAQTNYISNMLARSLQPEGHNVAVGDLKGGYPHIWMSTVDRNAVWDDVAREHEAGFAKTASLQGDAAVAYESLINTGGFSLTQSLEAADGGAYFTSVAGYESTTPLETFTPDVILAYRLRVLGELRSDPSFLIGGWVEGDTVYLDLSRAFQDEHEAVEFGRANGQLAVWDGFTNREIRLDVADDDLREARFKKLGKSIQWAAPIYTENLAADDERTAKTSAQELPMSNGLYYRWHPNDREFSRADASSKPFIPEGLEGTNADRYRDPKSGYSSFWNPHHLQQYMHQMNWEPENGRVVAFRGQPVGQGYDGEPLVVPHADQPEMEMDWPTFEHRLDYSGNGYGQWHEHTWGDGPDGQIVDDGYRSLGSLGLNDFISNGQIQVRQIDPDADDVLDYNGQERMARNPEGIYFNAYDGEQLVGSIMAELPSGSHSTTMETHQVFVLPQYRNTPAFMLLFRSLNAFAQQRGFQIWAWEFANPDVKAFYDRMKQRGVVAGS